MVFLQVADQPFAYHASQVPGLGSIRGTHDGPKGQGFRTRINHLQHTRFSIPQRSSIVAYLLQLIPQGLHGFGVIGVDKDRTNDFSACLGPILKGLFQKVRNRHNQAT